MIISFSQNKIGEPAVVGSATIADLTASKPVFSDANKKLVSTGTQPADQGGTGQTTYTDGQLLIGNTTGNTLAKASLAGTANQITVTPGSGSITLSAPQDLAPASTPAFADIYLGGPMVDVRTYDTFILAITGIGATEATLLIPNEQAVADDVTVPANVTLKFLRGGSLAISTTKTVTINGHVEAGLYKIFDLTGTGVVAFGVSSVEAVYPEWWGARGDGVTESSGAIQAAVTTTRPVRLSGHESTIYLVDTTIFLTPYNFKFYGNGAALKLANGSNTDVIDIPAGTAGALNDLVIDGNRANNDSGKGININRGLWLYLSNISIFNTAGYGIEISTADATTTSVYITHSAFQGMADAIHLYSDGESQVLGVHIDQSTFFMLTGSAILVDGAVRGCSVTKCGFEAIGRGIYGTTPTATQAAGWDISDNYVFELTHDFVDISYLSHSTILNNYGACTITLGEGTSYNTAGGLVTNLGTNNTIGDWTDAASNFKTTVASGYAGIFMGGNVGIGTTGPVNRLTVFENTPVGNNVGDVQNLWSFVGRDVDGFDQTLLGKMYRHAAGSNWVGVTYVLQRTAANSAANSGYVAFPAAGAIEMGAGLYPAGPIMTLLSSGNVGIGTTTPGQILDVNQGSGNMIADGYDSHSLLEYKERLIPYKTDLDKLKAVNLQKYRRIPHVSANELREEAIKELGKEKWVEVFGGEIVSTPTKNEEGEVIGETTSIQGDNYRGGKLKDCEDPEMKALLDTTADKLREERRKENKWKKDYIGLVADDPTVLENIPEVVSTDDEGNPVGIQMNEYIGVLHGAIRSLLERIERLEAN